MASDVALTARRLRTRPAVLGRRRVLLRCAPLLDVAFLGPFLRFRRIFSCFCVSFLRFAPFSYSFLRTVPLRVRFRPGSLAIFLTLFLKK